MNKYSNKEIELYKQEKYQVVMSAVLTVKVG